MKIYKSGLMLMLEKPEWLNVVAIPSEDSDYQIVATTVQVHDINEDVVYTCGVDEVQDESGALVGDLAAVTAYLNNIVGSANEGGGATGAGVQTWVYRNSDYIAGTRLTVPHNNFTETVVSNNVELLHTTETTAAHDGSKYVLEENDLIQISLSVKIDANTSASLLRFRARAITGNYTLRQSDADTNIQQFGQLLTYNFAPFPITAAVAAGGFDIRVSGFTSTADAFIYNIVQTIQKIGTKV